MSKNSQKKEHAFLMELRELLIKHNAKITAEHQSITVEITRLNSMNYIVSSTVDFPGEISDMAIRNDWCWED